MKTLNKASELTFSKNDLLELNKNELLSVKGGTGSVLSLGCTLCINSSNGPGNDHLKDFKL